MKNRLYVLFIMAVLLLLPVVSAVAEITVSGDMAKNAVSKDVAELAVLKDSIRIDAFEDMFADLDELRQPELADVTGQVGIMEFIFKHQKNIDYLTADIDPEMVMEHMDITNIQYPENSLDAIICNHVLEHIPDDRKAMEELYRVLKPGGWAILQVPFSKILKKTFEDATVTTSQDREQIFGQTDHVRIYGKDYTSRLKQAGFEVEEYKWTEDKELINPDNYFGLNEDEVVFFCIRVANL